MTNDQICECVQHYMQNDVRKGALMLSAPWEKGKSYFMGGGQKVVKLLLC